MITTAIKGGIRRRKNWKKIFRTIVLVCIFVAITLVIKDMFFRTNSKSEIIKIFLDTSEETSIHWLELFSVENVKREGDFRYITNKDVEDTALEFYNLKVWEKGGKALYYTGNEIKEFIMNNKHEMYDFKEPYDFKKILKNIDKIKKESNLNIRLTIRNFEDVISKYSLKKQGKARQFLTNSDEVVNEYKDYIENDIILKGSINIEGGQDIPLFLQNDVRWGNELYGSSGTIREAGCGPTSLSMVITYLVKNWYITPNEVAKWSAQNGYRAIGAGSYWSLMMDGARHYGVKAKSIRRSDKSEIVRNLKAGHPMIAIMDEGEFTTGGHFIVLRGISNEGKVLVNDPASLTRSTLEWDLEVIINESSVSAGEAGEAFWVFHS